MSVDIASFALGMVSMGVICGVFYLGFSAGKNKKDK